MHSIIFAMLIVFQAPAADLQTVLQRATAHVGKYEAELGNLIGAEDYLQTWTTGRPARRTQRRTESDLLIINVGKEWAALRKINRVDGSRIKKTEDAFADAFTDSPSDNSRRLVQMKTESTQYNLGDVLREINLPTFALKVLRENEVWRFNFEKAGTEKIAGVAAWVIHFTERGTATLVHGDKGELLHSTGRLWIAPETGQVLRTEFSVENPYGKAPVRARTTVNYTRDKALDLWIPQRMMEHYETTGSVIDCLAEYSRFRRFEVSVKFDFGPKPN